MHFQTADNVEVRFDRPNHEEIARETRGQMDALMSLYRTLIHGDGGRDILLASHAACASQPEAFAGSNTP